MKRPILFMLLAVSLLRVSASPLQQQPPAQKARIEGIVVRAGNGDAVPRARVAVTRSGNVATANPGGPRGNVVALGQDAPISRSGAPVPPPAAIPSVTTDPQGRFAIPDLDEGNYTLQVLANGYVNLNYGQHYFNGPGTPIALKAGQTLKDLSIAMTPASTISGHLRDREDRPLANVPVQLLRYSFDGQGQRSFQTLGTGQTNDRGEYRIYWMTPGRYYLMGGSPVTSNPLLAMIAAAEGGNVNPNQIAAPLSIAYYPGVPDISLAQPIDLQPGAILESINLIVPPRPSTFRIRGRVVDSRNGQAPPQARVAAVPDSDGVAANSEMNRAALEVPLNPYNASTGEFEVKDLVPGNYTVTAVVQSAGPPQAVVAGSPRGSTPLMGSVKVTVANSNVEGVSIAASPPAAIPGRVRVDGTLPFPMERLRLQLIQPNGPNGLTRTAAAVNPDGAFAFSNITSGDYRLTLQAQVVPTTGGAQPGSNAMYIKEARFDGADVLNGPLRVGSSVTTPLEIAIGVGGGQLTGVLSDRRGQPVPVSQVVLIPDRARDRIELFRISTTDPNGKFSIAGITPGDYKVFSWEGIEPNSWFDPDLLRQSETKGLAVHVTDSSTEMIEVRLITREDVQ